MVRPGIDSRWVREIQKENADMNDKYTFCGALEYRYNQIALYWNGETRKKHDRDYNNIILPALKDHDEKTIREYTKEDFEDAIERIREEGYMREGIRQQYAEATIHNFENLIYYVVFQASVYGLCDNVLWGTKFVLDVSDEEEEIESRVILKKSLSIDQEKRFCVEVMSDIEEDGAYVALLLMWGLGLRNAEACGLNYGDLKPLEGHPECYTAWIYKSTKINSNELQSGGKTYNTGRIIPIPNILMTFLNKRRALISKLIVQQGKADIDINDLPICCEGQIEEYSDNYLNRCKADQVSFGAHEIFEEAGILPKQLAFLDEELTEGNTAAILKEKEPTAYLLRRNFATQMCIVGLSDAEIQYLLGHDVEDAYESRNEFVDSERIYAMHQKLRQRELLNNKNDDNNNAEICIRTGETVKIHISAVEPTDKMSITITGDNDATDVKAKWYEESTLATSRRTVNIIKYYHKRYDN